MTGTLIISAKEAEELWLALGTRAFMLQSQGHGTGRIKSLQGRVDNVWAALTLSEKVRNGVTREAVSSSTPVEELAARGDFVPDAG